MFTNKLVVLLTLMCGWVALTAADDARVTTATKVFSNFMGGEPLTFATTISSSEADVVSSVTSGIDVTTTVVNHASPIVLTLMSSLPAAPTSMASSGNVFVSTIVGNHASPVVMTFTSNPTAGVAVTTTNTPSITTTITLPIQTITITISEASSISSKTIVTGFCYWGPEGVVVPCTYTAGILSTNLLPTSAYATTGNTTAPSLTAQIIPTTQSNLALPARANNPLKFMVDSVKRVLEVRQSDPVNNVTVPVVDQFGRYRNMTGTHWTKCDHVPIVWSPFVLTLLFFLNGLFIRFYWNKPSIVQNKNFRMVLFLVIFWGLLWPALAYVEIYASTISNAWNVCVLDESYMYPY